MGLEHLQGLTDSEFDGGSWIAHIMDDHVQELPVGRHLLLQGLNLLLLGCLVVLQNVEVCE